MSISPRTIRVACAMTFMAALAISWASGVKAVTGERSYRPVQAIDYALGSSRAVGHFRQHDNMCQITLMLVDESGVELRDARATARLRLALRPGQTAGVDSDAGRYIDLTCGPEAKSLTVQDGVWMEPTPAAD